MSNGGPAFPFYRAWENERKGYTESESSDGMSLRDYIAAKAMQGALADPSCQSEPEDMAKWAYDMADAMLKARGE